MAECLGSRHHIKVKGLSKPDRETMDGDFKRRCGRGASIASQTLRPTESPMGPLRSGLHVRGLNILRQYVLKRAKGEQNGLGAQQMEPSSTGLRALPIAPKDQARRRWLIWYRFIGR